MMNILSICRFGGAGRQAAGAGAGDESAAVEVGEAALGQPVQPGLAMGEHEEGVALDAPEAGLE